MKTAFLLLGVQRSGTSVTSHILSKFGISFGDPQNFLEAAHNPIFFELKWVNQYNDRILQRLGYQYTDSFCPLESDYETASILELEQELSVLIQQEWQDEAAIGLKDPRFSLTFPLWERVLTALGFKVKVIFVFRHPGNFLRSNQALFHNWEGWDEERHLQFWLRLTLAAIYFTRNYSIFLVNYDELMVHPLNVVRQLADTFKLDENQIDHAASVVNPAYQHHHQPSLINQILIQNYYNRLCSNKLSVDDYIYYCNSLYTKNDNFYIPSKN